MTDTLVMLSDRVLIAPDEADDVTKGGILERPQRGTVVSVGGGKVENGTLVAMTVQAGDSVLYAKYVGTEIRLNDKKYLIMRETDVMAIVRSEPDATQSAPLLIGDVKVVDFGSMSADLAVASKVLNG